MREFFHGWRRKVGCITLVMACAACHKVMVFDCSCMTAETALNSTNQTYSVRCGLVSVTSRTINPRLQVVLQSRVLSLGVPGPNAKFDRQTHFMQCLHLDADLSEGNCSSMTYSKRRRFESEFNAFPVVTRTEAVQLVNAKVAHAA